MHLKSIFGERRYILNMLVGAALCNTLTRRVKIFMVNNISCQDKCIMPSKITFYKPNDNYQLLAVILLTKADSIQYWI